MKPSSLPQALKKKPNWKNLDTAERHQAWQSAIALVGSMQQLSSKGEQVVQHMIGDAIFAEWEHYPDNDVRDEKHASQYFYHAHPGAQRPFTEHGHFHLFVHAEKLGMRSASQRYSPAPAHLIAISMDANGLPNGFFVVNRWVTKGPWLSLAHCERGLKHFQVKVGKTSKQVHIFLRSLVQLYYPHIIALLKQRDEIMEKLCAKRDRRSVFADTTLEVLCHLPIDLLSDIAALEELQE